MTDDEILQASIERIRALLDADDREEDFEESDVRVLLAAYDAEHALRLSHAEDLRLRAEEEAWEYEGKETAAQHGWDLCARCGRWQLTHHLGHFEEHTADGLPTICLGSGEKPWKQ